MIGLESHNCRFDCSKFPLFSRSLETFTVVCLFKHAMDESEVSRWLSSISCGLDLKQFSKDFEDRGFTTKESLKYVEATDLDVFFPSPRKLSYAQKKILLKEIERVGTVGSMKDTAMPQASTTAINTGNTPSEFIPPANHGSEFSKPTGFLERKQEGITDDIQFLNTRIASAREARVLEVTSTSE